MATQVLKDKSIKPLDMYQVDEDDDDVEIEQPTENVNPNYDFDMEEFNEDNDENQEDEVLDDELKARIEQDLLFLTQGVGSIKNINDFDVYVKHDQCEYSLKDIYRRLKTESERIPVIKLTLGGWQFLQKDLIPLLIFHK
jgi:hypothetical protein